VQLYVLIQRIILKVFGSRNVKNNTILQLQ